jgi:hypothetical protein
MRRGASRIVALPGTACGLDQHALRVVHRRPVQDQHGARG